MDLPLAVVSTMPNLLFCLTVFVLISVVCPEEAMTELEITSEDMARNYSIRFRCLPSYWTTPCQLLCQQFPKNCRKPGIPTATPTPTTTTTTTTVPPPQSCSYVTDCSTPDNCTACITCHGNKTCCPPGQIFLRPTGCTNFTCYVCTAEPPTTTEPDITTTLNPLCSEPFTCVGKPAGQYINPFNCSDTITCDNGGIPVITKTCPPGYWMNHRLSQRCQLRDLSGWARQEPCVTLCENELPTEQPTNTTAAPGPILQG